MTNTVRETKRADELKPGDWLALENIAGDTSPAEIAALVPFQPRGEVKQIEIIYREASGGLGRWPIVYDGLVPMATEAEVSARRERTERSRKIADIRAFADWLEANSWAPMPYSFDASVHLDERHPGGPTVADSLTQVRAVASRLGVQLEERLDDRTCARKSFGCISYDVVAWHPNGRLADESESRAEVRCAIADPHAPHRTTFAPEMGIANGVCPGVAVAGESSEAR